MKNKEEFIKLVDRRFFNHLVKKSLIPFEGRNYNELGNFYDLLLSNLGDYRPKPPRQYISVPKNKYVIRMVPTFELDDYCIYYFCIKVLEEYIAENRVKGTYGGYRLGGRIREQENSDFEPAYEDSINENSFNTFAWRKEYGEYQTKLRENALLMGDKYQFAVHFDIANFYDCIRLDLLNKKIKDKIGNISCNDEINILMNLLKYWNSFYDENKSVGIPQDEIGDCSRILANFFLQDYDQSVYNECINKDAFYLRYADDQIIFAKNKEDAEEILYLASQKLFEEGLNINTGKIKEFQNYQSFDDCFGFTIFEKLKFESQNVNDAFDLFVIKKETCSNFRESGVLKRLLHKKIRLEELQNQKRIKLLSYLWEDNFLLGASEHYMKQIYKMLKDSSEKEEYLGTLKAINEKTKFTSFQINFNKFFTSI